MLYRYLYYYLTNFVLGYVFEEEEEFDWRKEITVKKGLDTSKLKPEIINLFPIIVESYREVLGDDVKPRLTSTNEKVKGRLKNSYHYINLAVDFGFWYWVDKKRVYISPKDLDKIYKRIRRKAWKISPFYDIVKKSNHFHNEYDLRRAKKKGGK